MTIFSIEEGTTKFLCKCLKTFAWPATYLVPTIV